jgi:Uma2 family endonuclease
MATTLIPLDQYLNHAGDFEPDADYVDGAIEVRPMGEYDHATWQDAIGDWFKLHKLEWNIRVRAELRVQVSATRYRVPDVVVWDRSRPTEQILTWPPIAVFEVLSPEDRMPRMMIKLADYERMGIPTIRVIDPGSGAISQFQAGVLSPISAAVEQLPGSECVLDWPKIRELLDL